MAQKYTAVVKQDAEWWIGWIEEVPGVIRTAPRPASAATEKGRTCRCGRRGGRRLAELEMILAERGEPTDDPDAMPLRVTGGR